MRIASLTCSNTEIVCALGRGDWLVGVDDYSDHPPDVVGTLPRLGPDLGIEVDRLAALEPDLVLASLTVPGHEKVVAAVEAAGLTSIAPAPERLEDIYADIRTIGSRLDAESRAEELVARMQSDLAALAEERRGSPAVPIVVEWWPKPVIVPGRDSWVTDLLTIAGGVNPFGGRPAKSLTIEPGEAVAADIGGVAISWCGVEEHNYKPQKVLDREGWSEIPAVRHEHVVPIAEAYLGRPGPRVVEGARRLAALVDRCRS